MANITQTIHSLTGGISQQPDEQKIPGQVKNLVNAIPDITTGLVKRPAGKFVASLSDGTNNSTADGKWFHYYRDENEQYIGQIARNGVVKMWDCLTGAEKTVVNAIGNNTYLTHTNEQDIQTLTLNDFTYINNRSITTEMDTTVEPLGDFKKEIFVELKSISYSKQYALNVFDNTNTTNVSTATRIDVELVGSSNNYGTSGGYLRTHATRDNIDDYDNGSYAPTDNSAGEGNDAYAPNVGTRIFDVSDNKEFTDENAVGGLIYNNDNPVEIGSQPYSAGTEYYYNRVATTSGTNFKYTIKVRRGIDNTEVDTLTGTSARSPKNLYFRIRTTGQSVPFTTGSGENQTTNYKARYTTTYDLLHGGQGWQEGDYFFVWMKDGFYKVTIKSVSTSAVQANLGLVRPNPTPFDTETTITAESILGDIRKELTGSATATTGNGFTITQIGNGLHIKRDAIFNASTPVGELLNVVTSKVNDAGDLPTQCKHGMVVEVINNAAAEEDNYYVKFFGNNDKDGEGIWEECAKPGRKIRFKYSKMPVALIRTADGNFRLTELDGSSYTISGNSYSAPQWDDAIVGDEDTNPEPSFIGKAINKMLFFRNRLAMLADEFIVLSRPGNFFNFFGKTALELTAADPVDISASSEYPAILFDGIQVNTGLVLFTENQQFMLTTDSDQFTPLTAKINNLASYNFNKSTNPISLGTTVGFLDNAGKYSRFFEMNRIQREGEVQVIEQSKVVSKLFEKDLKLVSNSRENSVVFFSEKDTNVLYGYRYFNQITDRQLASWFKWTVSGNIQYHCMQDDSLFVVVRNNSKQQLLKFSIKVDTDSQLIDENRVHLDHLMTVSGFTYNSATNKSTKAKPVGLESSNQLVAYDVDQGVNSGRYAPITVNGSNLEILGDWSNESFVIGYLYTMQIDFPKIYYVTREGERYISDARSDTIIHRVKFGFGSVGVYEATLTRQGKSDYTELFEVKPANIYQANSSGIFDDDVLRTIPIYDRNLYVNLSLKSTHPTPATLQTMAWEGIYNNKFYERV
tara:strand:- start:30 stop:3110 length:3081 start_codon:yes stop_codon:yes gene_type:complete